MLRPTGLEPNLSFKGNEIKMNIFILNQRVTAEICRIHNVERFHAYKTYWKEEGQKKNDAR